MERNTLERREKIKDMILTSGLWSLNKKQLARDFGVSYPTIYSDIKAIVKDIPDDKVEVIGYELNQSFKDALSISRSLLNQKDDSLKLKAVDVLTKAIDRYTVFLEAFGKKPILPKKIAIESEGRERIIFVNIPTENFIEWRRKNNETDMIKVYDRYKTVKINVERMVQKTYYSDERGRISDTQILDYAKEKGLTKEEADEQRVGAMLYVLKEAVKNKNDNQQLNNKKRY